MNRFLIILLILISYRGSSQIKWASLGDKWNVSVLEGNFPPNQGYILFEVTKDTVLAETKVKVISKTYYHSNGKDVSILKSEYTYEKDSIVYYWENGEFYVLYNFKAKPGDKWTVYGTSKYQNLCNYESVGTVIVDSVSTVKVNNKKLKAIYTSPYQNSNWGFKGPILETIGNINHPFPKAKECAVDIPDDEGQLRCFENKDLGGYKAGYCGLVDCDCNELKNYTSVNWTENSSLSIYPNPVKDFLEIRQDNDSFNNLIAIEIYDINGEKAISSEGTDKLFVGFLKSGLHIVELLYDDHKFFFKIIKE